MYFSLGGNTPGFINHLCDVIKDKSEEEFWKGEGRKDNEGLGPWKQSVEVGGLRTLYSLGERTLTATPPQFCLSSVLYWNIPKVTSAPELMGLTLFVVQ